MENCYVLTLYNFKTGVAGIYAVYLTFEEARNKALELNEIFRGRAFRTVAEVVEKRLIGDKYMQEISRLQDTIYNLKKELDYSCYSNERED